MSHSEDSTSVPPRTVGLDLADRHTEICVIDLEALATEDLWARSGGHADGRYVEPTEAAYAMVREAVEPHLARLEDLLEEGREEDADVYVRGVLLGLNRYDRESEREFRRWAVDAPEMMADEAKDRWREGRPDQEARHDLSAWIASWRSSPSSLTRSKASRASGGSSMAS